MAGEDVNTDCAGCRFPQASHNHPTHVTLTLDDHGHVVVAGTTTRAATLMLARGSIGGAYTSDEDIIATHGVDRAALDVLHALYGDVSEWF